MRRNWSLAGYDTITPADNGELTKTQLETNHSFRNMTLAR
jgi:hypothetical protein